MEVDGAGMQTPGAAAARYSYLFPIGYSNSSECGYCRQTRRGFSYYAIATSLTPEFYQKLVDRCWRRSGSLLYRPNQKHSCCPHYTLRLDSTQFKPTKDQRQAVNRFNRYVLGETYPRDAARLHPRSRAEVRRRHNVFDLVERIHEPEAGVVKTPPSPDHVFTVALEPDTFTEEKYEIFENYQRIVHREPPDKISRHGFMRFLCNSPLRRGSAVGPDGTERQLGSFHHCYRIDGKLVAVGVLDLLPDCVSAVYFFYHESIHWLNPGKLGALREIALAREAGYRWWYPGYYVHNCAKMRYKIDYKPQYVLDPEDLRWYPLDKDALARFDKHHYVCFSREDEDVEMAEDSGGKTVTDSASALKPDEPGPHASSSAETEATSPPPAGPAPSQTQPMNSTQANSYGDSSSPSEPESNSSADSAEEEEEEEDSTFLLTSSMPGIPSLEDMRRVDMDGLVLRADFSDNLIVASHLVIWDTEDVAQFGSLKSRIAELVAAVGPDLLGEICIDFRKRSSAAAG
ncbi:301dd9cc-9340-41c1-b80a-eedff2a1316f [Thermothielavioides terrestris]|uniref:arginyltransferase n=1 Tax=Thermothielavioides terrestris TaxID=2587410 RepID=A0A3S4DAZ3_9PEZI|nr:301dd9cc-9340-41c1-b80a-eedff2a1316f [Thermothielavioides terrestris]